jgi:AraC-like DNA-binding protein
MHFINYDIECIYNSKKFIDADITSHHTIPEIVTHAGISGTKLKAGFKKIFHLSIYQYYHEQRMQKALHIIQNTDKSVKQISMHLGYRYPVNFTFAFKKRYGVTPTKVENW